MEDVTREPIFAKLDDNQREIRLIQIVQDHNGRPFQCFMRSVSLDDKPEYIALSYCWGDPNVTHKIFVNGNPYDVTIKFGGSPV
jgi:hypothetical protein